MDDKISRAEMIGIAINLYGIKIPTQYTCKKYFKDAEQNDWICRAAEMAADAKIVSRKNISIRPYDKVLFTESMAIISDAQCLEYKRGNFQNFYKVGLDEEYNKYDDFYSKFTASLDTPIPSWESQLIA